jgi:hypothetical protein
MDAGKGIGPPKIVVANLRIEEKQKELADASKA